MKLTIIDAAHHRNGISGAPFVVVLFENDGPEASRKVAILFDEPNHCAVLDLATLAAGIITFGVNSWRGDQYEPHLRDALAILPPTRGVTMKAPANHRRAMRIGHILTWCKDWNSKREGLIDLLADARHWCDCNGESFAQIDRIAYQHYLNERNSNEGDSL